MSAAPRRASRHDSLGARRAIDARDGDEIKAKLHRRLRVFTRCVTTTTAARTVARDARQTTPTTSYALDATRVATRLTTRFSSRSDATHVETFTVLHQHPGGPPTHAGGVRRSNRALLSAVHGDSHHPRRLSSSTDERFREGRLARVRLARTSDRWLSFHRHSSGRDLVAKHIHPRTVRLGATLLRRRSVHRTVRGAILHSSDANVGVQAETIRRNHVHGP